MRVSREFISIMSSLAVGFLSGIAIAVIIRKIRTFMEEWHEFSEYKRQIKHGHSDEHYDFQQEDEGISDEDSYNISDNS